MDNIVNTRDTTNTLHLKTQTLKYSVDFLKQTLIIMVDLNNVKLES